MNIASKVFAIFSFTLALSSIAHGQTFYGSSFGGYGSQGVASMSRALQIKQRGLESYQNRGLNSLPEYKRDLNLRTVAGKKEAHYDLDALASKKSRYVARGDTSYPEYNDFGNPPVQNNNGPIPFGRGPDVRLTSNATKNSGDGSVVEKLNTWGATIKCGGCEIDPPTTPAEKIICDDACKKANSK